MVVEIAHRYELADPLGHGGMGTVWRAHDQVLKRDVALKEVQFPSYIPEAERRALRERVLQEARAAARLSHPGAVTVYDVFEDDDKTFIAMELVEGPSLAELVSEGGPLPPDLAAKIGSGLLQTLSEAHAKGIIHRDVKPGNVMVAPDGSVKLTDFGIASVTGGPELTATGVILGSPSYMSPEQGRGEPASPASDLWALGATLYFAVKGRPPFEKGEPLPTLNAILTEEPAAVEGPLGRVIMDLLSKDPADRPGADKLRPLLESLARASGLEPAAQTLRLAEEPPAYADDPATATPTAPAPSSTGFTASEPDPRTDIEGPAAGLPAQGGQSRRVGTNKLRRWVAPVAALLVVAGALILVARMPTAQRQGAAPSNTAFPQSAHPSAPPVSGQSPRQKGNTTDEAAVPRTWKTAALGATGYEIKHPPSWRVTRDPLGDGNSVRFTDRSGKYLLVDWTGQPGRDAVAAWRQQARSFAERHENYSEIRIEPTTFRDFDTAAIWEFTYSEGGATLHAIDLGFADERWGFALNFQTREAEWEESQGTFEQFKASFART